MVWNIDGCEVLIDDEDYERLKVFKYYVDRTRAKKQGHFYFHRSLCMKGTYTMTLLHRDIMNCIKGDGKIVDHINGNTLDCSRDNLRICTLSENNRNQKIRKTSTSGVKGVSWHKATNKWQARIRVNKVQIHLGYFTDLEDAAKAYAEASKKYHGEFGRLR